MRFCLVLGWEYRLPPHAARRAGIIGYRRSLDEARVVRCAILLLMPKKWGVCVVPDGPGPVKVYG